MAQLSTAIRCLHQMQTTMMHTFEVQNIQYLGMQYGTHLKADDVVQSFDHWATSVDLC